MNTEAPSKFQQLKSFVLELTRRRVVRTTGVYVVGIWALAQGFADLFPAFGLPDWTIQAFVIGGILGIPVVALLSWKFNITLGGIVRDPGPPVSDQDDTLFVTGALENGPGCSVVAIWTDHRGAEQRRVFVRGFVIGRDAMCDVHIADKRISRRHARVFHRDDKWVIEDLNSANGTYANGAEVSEMELPQRAEITCHNSETLLELRQDAMDATVLSGAAAVDPNATLHGGAPAEDEPAP